MKPKIRPSESIAVGTRFQLSENESISMPIVLISELNKAGR